jgi:hypothetical protein
MANNLKIQNIETKDKFIYLFINSYNFDFLKKKRPHVHGAEEFIMRIGFPMVLKRGCN